MFRFFRFLALPKIVIRERIVRIKLDTCFNVDITITVSIPQLLVSDGVIRLVVSVSALAWFKTYIYYCNL